jgi:adenosylmethionine-8-amino-7-oxononanoate aminotransferase
MSDLIVLGTDTDAGKTTFCLLWLAAFADRYEYWKPVETGDSDSERVAALITDAVAHAPVRRFVPPVAPPLAARLSGDVVPAAATIATARPKPGLGRSLLVETFGSPFSPLNEQELQISLIKALGGATVLVSSSTLGTIGRTLSFLQALAAHRVYPVQVVLMGPQDEYAVEQIRKHGDVAVLSLQVPRTWTPQGIQDAAKQISEERCGQLFGGVVASRPKLEDSPRSLVERDRQVVWHPYTSLHDAEPPLTCVGAEDEFLLLADGRKIIDGISSWWTILHGHRHPVLLKALHEATTAFDHVHFAGVTHAPAVELAELLLSTAPWQGGRVFYSDNGSTAVEVALKMAYQYWCHQGEAQRTRFVGFEGGYHGDTFGAMAVSRDPVFFGRFEPLLFQTDILPLSPQRLDELLTRQSGHVAAIIIEPLVQGAGGMRMHSPQVLRDLFEVAKNHDVLFIADEVMTGGGRTGSLWAHQSAGIAPDLICAAKTLAGGMLPLAATLVAPRVVRAWETSDAGRTFFHGHSFTAHPLACAVAAANWKVLTGAPNPAPARIEAFWRDALAPLRDNPKVREVRMRGSIAAVELNDSGGYLAGVGRPLRRRCLEDGILLRPLGSVLYTMPPFCTSVESLERIAGAMIRAVQAI